MRTLIEKSKSPRCVLLLLAISTVTLRSTPCQAHDGQVHEKITASAAALSDRLISFLGQNNATLDLPKFTADQTESTAVEWLSRGSRMEDDPIVRSLDHFYTLDPVRVPGDGVRALQDGSEPWYLAPFFGPLGLPSPRLNSYVWAAESGWPGPPLVGPNQYNWPKARDYEDAALTSAYPDDRKLNMALMLFSLGHVVHLNQDLSSPDHVRNDNHGSSARIEEFGQANFEKHDEWFIAQKRDWGYWQAQGFSQLLHFWDRGKFKDGSSEGLDADARGNSGARLGLAEFSSGNFLGEDALYAEYFRPGDQHYFPFPSLADTTEPQVKPGRLAETLRPITLRNFKQGNRPFISKIGAGIHIDRHSAIHYLAVLNSPKMALTPTPLALTVNDDDVRQEYHQHLLPKAVEYSAGILDYFFRGRLDITVGWDAVDLVYRFHVVNKSGQNLLGGSFSLLQEDGAGNRTPVTPLSFNYTGVLADGGCIEGTLSGPVASSTKYVLIYKGTIGSSGGTATDPVDADRAIAVRQFDLNPLEAYPGSGPRVRIKDFDKLVAALPLCADCQVATTQPVWDGTFDVVEFWSDWYNCYPSSGINSLSLNGKVLYDPYVFWDWLGGYYTLSITCKTAGNQTRFVWIGKKSFGSNAAGTYVRDAAYFGDQYCSHGFCAEDVDALTLEAY